MKNRFVKITLTLTMLLVLAVPAQVFAADNNCTLNQSKTLSIQISKIYSQLPQSAVNQLTDAVKQCQNGNIDAAQLQNLMNQLCQKASVTAAAPAKAADTAPAKVTTATPAKETAAAPVKTTTTTPAKETTTTPAKETTATPAKETTATPAKETTTTPAKTTTTTPDSTVQTPADTASSTLGTYEQQVVDLVNKERAAAGLPALKVNTKLAAVAEKKAEDMRDNNYFSHTSPTYGSPFDMMRQFGISYTAAGENIAKGQKTPADVMNGWMNSSGHRANILNSSYTEIGVGYVTDSSGNTYWVQQFIRP